MPACLIAFSLIRLAHAEQRIELTSRICSLTELCSALQAKGVKVKADPSVGNRVCAVRLQALAWDDARAALSEGLGIEIKPSGDGGWTIRESARARDENRKSFETYSSLYARRIGEVFAAADTIVKNATPKSVLPYEERLRGIVDGTEKSTPTEILAARYLLNFMNGGDSISVWNLQGVLHLHDFVRSDQILSGNAVDFANSTTLPTWLRAIGFIKVFEPEIVKLPLSPADRIALNNQLLADTYMVHRLSFDPVGGSLEGRYSVALKPEAGTGGDTPHLVAPGTVPVSPPGLRDVSRDYPQNLERTRAFLKTAVGQVAFEVPARTRSLSEIFLLWADKVERNIVVDVSTLRDLSPTRVASGGASSTTLWKELSIPALVDLLLVEALANSNAEGQARSRHVDLVRGLARESAWTIGEVKSAVVVKNEYRFLDDYYRFDPSSLLKLYRDIDGKTKRPSLESLEKYAQGTSDKVNAAMARTNPSLIPDYVPLAYPFLRLLGKANEATRKEIYAYLSKEGIQRIPASKFPASAMGEFLRGIQTLTLAADRAADGAENRQGIILHPRFVAIGQRGDLWIQGLADPSGGRKMNVALSVPRRLVIPNVTVSQDRWYLPDPRDLSRDTVIWRQELTNLAVPAGKEQVR